jgi:Cdc6-like AAA superfamily ATPase
MEVNIVFLYCYVNGIVISVPVQFLHLIAKDLGKPLSQASSGQILEG